MIATQRSTAVAVILTITSVVVLIPIFIQMRSEGLKLRDTWGYFLFVVGLLCVAAGYGFFADTRQTWLAVGGLAAALLGLFIQHRDPDSRGDSTDEK